MILIVDDDAINRKLLVSLLSHYGHDVVEAKDGKDGLAAAHVHRPQLVISDIVMPTMDGFSFARALRAEPLLQATQVIFYTAIYHEREAERLARECQVACVLIKPCEPAVLLAAVKQALAGVAPPADLEFARDFDGQHLTLLSNKLSEKTNALAAANARLFALQDLNILLTSSRDPHLLLERVCAGARRLVGCRFALLAARDGSGEHKSFVTASGLSFGATAPSLPSVSGGPGAGVAPPRRAWRAHARNGDCLDCGLPSGYPPIRSVLAVPLVSETRALGWLCLADKLGAESFDADDERYLGALGAMAGRLHEICSWQSERLGDMEMLQDQEDRIRERLDERESHLQRLHGVMRGLLRLAAQAGSREGLYDGVCRLLVAQGCVDLAFIDARESPSDEFRTVAAAGDPDSLPQAPSREAASVRFLAASVIDSAQPVVCNELRDASEFLAFHQSLFRRGYRALAVVPLPPERGATGCLIVATRRPDCFDGAEVRLLTAVADAIALSVGRLAREPHAA